MLRRRTWTAPRRVLVLGGTSEIAGAVLTALDLPSSAEVILAGRSTTALEAAGRRLRCRVSMQQFDAADTVQHQRLVSRVFAAGPVDLVLPAFGILGDQLRAEADPTHAVEILDLDLSAQVSVVLRVALAMREQGYGTIVVFSSVAGVRARRVNFVYGAAKAGLDAFASGLTDALTGSGVHVLTVRPGFVVGRMTRGMPPAPFAVTPDVVGRAVAAALGRGRDVVWVPAVLRGVAVAMRLTPRRIWRRLPR